MANAKETSTVWPEINETIGAGSSYLQASSYYQEMLWQGKYLGDKGLRPPTLLQRIPAGIRPRLKRR